jgi:predicted secreted protein
VSLFMLYLFVWWFLFGVCLPLRVMRLALAPEVFPTI